MPIKKSFFCFLCLSLIFSCYPDKGYIPLPVEKECLLVEQDCQDCAKDIYAYDNHGRLISYTNNPGDPDYEYKQLYEYDAYNRIVGIKTYLIGVLDDSTTVTYPDSTPYRPSDFNYRWSSYEHVYVSADSSDSWLVKAYYDSQGRRSKVESYLNGNLETEDTFVYSGNDISLANYKRGESSNRIVYTYYEDKKDRLRNFGELVTMGDGGGEPYAEHLVKSATFLDHPDESYTVEYEFNEHGYPLKERIYHLDGSLDYERENTFHCD